MSNAVHSVQIGLFAISLRNFDAFIEGNRLDEDRQNCNIDTIDETAYMISDKDLNIAKYLLFQRAISAVY